MRSFVLWRGAPIDPDAVEASLRPFFAGFFESVPPSVVRALPGGGLVAFALPVKGWKPPSFQEDEERWAFAVDYPLDGRGALERRGVACADDEVLPRLAALLERDDGTLLADLTPPFALVWGHKASGVAWVMNDGLGMAQLFEARRGELRAWTNRPKLLEAVGFPLRASARQWATRLALGWFPGDAAGFEDVRFVPPGTRARLDPDGRRVEHATLDVLPSWVAPAPMDRAACLDLAQASLLRLASDAMAQWEKPTVGLSGGWDSRMVVAVLRHLGSDMALRVRGNPDRIDVRLAHVLARMAGMKIRTKTTGGWPPDDAAGCRTSIERALAWQAGNMTTKKHKTFLARDPHLDGGTINVMGQHGGLGKSDFVRRIDALDHPPEEYEERLLDRLLKSAPPFLRAEHREALREDVRAAYRVAGRYGLDGIPALHFFFLHEFTRRWASATLSSQPGMVFAPILNPDFIRAAYAFPERELVHKPFHRHVTADLAPDWAQVPYEDQMSPEDVSSGRLPPPDLEPHELRKVQVDAEWKAPTNRRKYHYATYWREVGLPLVEAAVASEGFAAELFDLDAARDDWPKAPDELVIAHLLPWG